MSGAAHPAQSEKPPLTRPDWNVRQPAQRLLFECGAGDPAREIRRTAPRSRFGTSATIPLYNQDFEGEKRPAPVKALLSAIAESDGLVLCAPEFNHSIPGVLKNALDWASRPAFTSVMAYKPVAIMATSRGALGGARCLEHLRVALDSMLSRVALAREVIITSSADKIRDGRLVDETSLGFACGAVEALLHEIRVWRVAAG